MSLVRSSGPLVMGPSALHPLPFCRWPSLWSLSCPAVGTLVALYLFLSSGIPQAFLYLILFVKWMYSRRYYEMKKSLNVHSFIHAFIY